MVTVNTLLCLLSLCLSVWPVHSQDQCHVTSSVGTDFVFGIPSAYAAFQSITLLMTTENNAEVRVTAPFLNLNKHLVFSKHVTMDIGPTVAHSTNGTQFQGIELHSNAPIWASITTGSGYDFESFLLLPTNALSTEYFIPSYNPYNSRYYMSQFLIVGTEADTTVHIEFPSTFTPWANGQMQIELQKYKTYLFTNLIDTTGTLVASDKPVAVITGTSYGTVPANGAGYGYMVEQVLPTRFYSYKYVVPAISLNKDYYIRMFSLYDNTEVNMYNSTDHDSHYLNRLEPAERHFFEEPTVLLADKPIYVMIYSTNPFMMTAQALDQFQTVYEFALQGTYEPNVIAVTIKTADLHDLYLDGSQVAINNSKVTQVASPLQDYSVIYIPVRDATIHRLHHARQRKFGAVLYGTNTYAYGLPLQMTLTDVACYQTNDTNTTVAPGQGSHLGPQINYQASGTDIHCFNCEDMTHLKYCDKVVTCRDNEVCYVQSYTKSLNTARYRSGCIDKLRCIRHGTTGCFECCEGSYCNSFGCGDDGLAGISHRGPFCFECQHQGIGDVCESVQLCSLTEVCSDRKREVATELDREGRKVPICSHCCTTDFCNSNCSDRSTSPAIVG